MNKTKLLKQKKNFNSIYHSCVSENPVENKVLHTAGSSGSADAAPRMTKNKQYAAPRMTECGRSPPICHCEKPKAQEVGGVFDFFKTHPTFPYALWEGQAGRSMVEMLGVLAVMGVLSVAGIAGYNSAMNKHRANELLNEASKRATVVAAQVLQERETLSISEFGTENTRLNFSETVDHDTTNKQFTLTITGVAEAVCQQTNNAKGPVIRKFEPATCSGDNNTVKLTYNDDMSATAKASDYDGDETGCTGAGNQYCTSNDTCISATDTCPPSGPSCTINPETDCLSKALLEGECACAPVTGDNVVCTSWTTNECGKGKYCVFSVNSCTDDPTSGTCQPVSYIGGSRTETVSGHEYTMSHCRNCPDWWSAQSWCKAHGKTMVSLSDLHCTSSGCTDTFWQDLGNALYQYSTWTTDMYGSCNAFYVSLSRGDVSGSRRYNSCGVLCR